MAQGPTGWQRLLADLPGAVLAIGDDGIVRYANEAAGELLGEQGEVGATLGLPVSRHGFLELRTSPGHTVEVRSAPSELDGVPVTVILLNDVTDLASSRQHLQDNIDAFEFALGITAHELRNPLAVLLAALDTLVEREDAVTREELLKLFPRMRWHANRMRVLVDNTLAVTSGAEHQQVVPEPVDLVEAVRGCLRHAADPSLFVFDEPADRSNGRWTASVTRRHIEQILLNLISNAEKYGAPPYVFSLEAGDRLVLQLRDHGTGVPGGQGERIFERYVRGHDDGQRRGTGLGLWVCRELARRHGGDVTHEAAEPGSVFRVTLHAHDDDPGGAGPRGEDVIAP